MHQLYVLFENASGYALFRTSEFEEIAMFVPEVQKSVLDVSKFRSKVFLVAFHPFKTGSEALANMKRVTEGKLHIDLQLFLESNVPRSKKSKQSVVLGLQDPKLAAAINETLAISCLTTGAVAEIIRGIRFHFHKLVKGYKDPDTIVKSELGLGHHYSKAVLNFDIFKLDGLITHVLTMQEQMTKDINTLTLRVREWYSSHFPELIKIVPDTELYIKCVNEIKDRNNMSEEIKKALDLILVNAEKVDAILESAHSSMGMQISEEDMDNIIKFIEQITSLINRRNQLTEYLDSKMLQVAPNLSELVGESVGAQLITQAGSLSNLAKLTASTVQILGAKKSLFRTLKKKGQTTSDFSLLKQTTLVGKAGSTIKGRMSRFIANKCSLASRIDCFRVTRTNMHGKNLKQLVEDRLKFYETGKYATEENSAILKERKKVLAAKRALVRKLRRQRKKNKSLPESNSSPANEVAMSEEISSEDTVQIQVEKKKARRKSKVVIDTEDMEVDDIETNGVNGISKSAKKRKSKHKKKAYMESCET